MSDTVSNTPQAATIPMTVLSQYLKDFSFENPHAPQILSLMAKEQPQVSVNVSLTTSPLQAAGPNQPPVYECAMTLKAESMLGGQTAFIIECVYAGAFAFPADLPEPVLRALLTVEAPRMLFPFARVIISDAARDGGYGPFMINPIDFASMYERQLQFEAQAANAPQTGTA